MQKRHYIYLVLGIIVLGIWILDILSFFSIDEIWKFSKGVYGCVGWSISLFLFASAVPDDEEDKLKIGKLCDLCGDSIFKNEESVHLKNGADYCERCAYKIKDL